MDTPKEYIEVKPRNREEEGNHSHIPNSQSPLVEEDEIDLLELFQYFWKGRKVILYSVAISFIVGLFIAFVTPIEYSSEIVLMPQSSSASSGGTSNILKQIGGFAGISLGEPSGTLDKTLYPDITQSTPFYLSLMEEETYFPTLDTTITLYQYFAEIDTPPFIEYVKQYTIGLPRKIINLPVRLISLFKDSPTVTVNRDEENSTEQDSIANEADRVLYKPVSLTNRQLGVLSRLRERVTTTIEANGMVKVSAEMPDPMVSAYTTQAAVEYLTSYVKDYRVEKLQANVSFIEQQYEEKKTRYNRAQQRLASLRDRNANIVTERGRIDLERAQTEYNLAFSLYQSVAQQLEQAKVRVQEETPVFKVLEPIQVPLRPSKPNKELIIILSILAGFVIGSGIILSKFVFKNLKSKVNG